MGAQAKTINLLLYDGSLQGVISIEDSGWYSGEMYIAPRASMDSLLSTDACVKYGVYLLLAHNRVYVGQSSDLSRRLTQHLSGKEWWENAIVLTTKDDSLNHADIDWLEASLIERARSISRLECDNHQRGNPIKVDRFREVFLRQYLDEALFLMEFVGISVFVDKPTAKENPRTTRVDLTDVHNRLAFGTRSKVLAIQYATEHGAEVSAHANYAVRAKNRPEFFLNPQKHMLERDWTLVLNDNEKYELIVLRIPPHSLEIGDINSSGLMLRKDKREYLDLHIDANTLRDRVSGVGFSEFLVARIRTNVAHGKLPRLPLLPSLSQRQRICI